MPGENRSRHSSQGSSSSSVRSPLQRKQTLRSFLTRAQSLRQIDKEALENFEEMIQETDNITLETSIEDKVSCKDEVLLDSQIMEASSRMLKASTSSLTKVFSPYSFQDFAAKLLTYVHMLPDTTLEKPNWRTLEEEVTKIMRKTPNFSTLSGCLDPLEKKVVVKRQQVKREALAPTSRPQAVVNVEKEKDAIERTVQKIKHLISKHYKETAEPIDFFRLILHPEDFGKTVENMLHISFLVRDDIVTMVVDNDGNLLVKPASKALRAEVKNGNKPDVQNIISLNVDQWRMLINAYGIERPMIDFG